MKKKNVSTTKSIKDGVPAKCARNWTLNSNLDMGGFASSASEESSSGSDSDSGDTSDE
jgi:hypothetical protein